MAKRISTPNPSKSYYSTFEEFYSEMWGPLQKRFFYSEKDHQTSEDLAQETMIRVWKYWDRIDWTKINGAFATIANNARWGYQRKDFNRVDTEKYDNVLEYESDDDGIEDPIKKLLNSESYHYVKKALGELTDDERELFKDRYLRNLTLDQVVSIHGITRNNLYVKLFRIRDKIKVCLNKVDISAE